MTRHSPLLVAVWLTMVAGSARASEAQAAGGPPDGSPPPVTACQRQFQELYRTYSTRFHEAVLTRAEEMKPEEIAAEASAIWADVFKDRAGLLGQRCQEILAGLEATPAPDESEYFEVICHEPCREGRDEPVLRHRLWSPVAAADVAVERALCRVLSDGAKSARSAVLSHVDLTWEAVRPAVDKPVLLQRQGLLVFVVELSRRDDCYRAEKVRWLRPKSMGPIAYYQKPPAEADPGETAKNVPEAPAGGVPVKPVAHTVVSED